MLTVRELQRIMLFAYTGTSAPPFASYTTYLWCYTHICTASSTVRAHQHSHLQPATRGRRASSHQVCGLLPYIGYDTYIAAVRRDWREKQAAEIKARDEASKAKRGETIAKAEKAIDQFYEEYASKKERNIRENKCVISRTVWRLSHLLFSLSYVLLVH